MNTIEYKFNIGQKVWFINSNDEIESCRVDRVIIKIGFNGIYIKYESDTKPLDHLEENLFATQKEAERYLEGKI